MERNTKSICRSRPFWGLLIAFSCLFAGFAVPAKGMLMTLYFRWDIPAGTADPDEYMKETYNLQEGSIIQVIAYKGEGGVSPDVVDQFGDAYGHATDTASAEPFDSGHDLGPGDVYLADNTQEGHTILYTGSVHQYSSWYGLYTQITVDDYMYDHVYIRIFGATEFPQGTNVASYWGVSTPIKVDPDFQTQTYRLTNPTNLLEYANWFEVIPEPATLGLLGLGGCALAVWRRRRPVHPRTEGSERQEDSP